MSISHYSVLLILFLGITLVACTGADKHLLDTTADTTLANSNAGDTLTIEQNEFIESASAPLPPMSDFIDDEGNPLFSKEEIARAKAGLPVKLRPASLQKSKVSPSVTYPAINLPD